MELEPISGMNSAQGTPEPVSVPIRMDAPHKEVAAEAVSPRPVMESDRGAEGRGDVDDGEDRAVSEKTIDDAVRSANHKIKMTKTRCEYAYHEKTNRVSIKVFDADTNEVIREIPPEKSLKMLEKMWEMAGVLVDEKR